jgi:hypothetical protein
MVDFLAILFLFVNRGRFDRVQFLWWDEFHHCEARSSHLYRAGHLALPTGSK